MVAVSSSRSRLATALQIVTAEKPSTLWGVEALEWSRAARKQRQSEYAQRRDEIVRKNRYYHENVFCRPRTRLVIYSSAHLWERALDAASKVRLRERYVEPNWLTDNDLKGFLELAGFDVLKTYNAVLFPKWIPLLSEFCNRFLAKLPGLRKLCLVKMFVARPAAVAQDPNQVSVSVIIPCSNEHDNVEP